VINSPVEEIKSRLDILDVIQGYIKLQKTGANWRARCPFHAEKSPSFFVSPSKQLWRCFGCSAGGDMFKFIMQIEGIEFRDALHSLAKRAGVELKKQDPKIQSERQRMHEICELAAQFFQKQLGSSTNGKRAKEYLLGRGITDGSIEEFRLGYAPDQWRALSDFLIGKGYTRDEIANAGVTIKKEASSSYYDRFRGRVMFPVFDAQGQVIGFGGRIAPWREKKKPKLTKEKNKDIVVTPESVDLPKDIGEPKYLNTPQTLVYDKSKVLYGLHIAKVEIRRNNFCIVMEGYTDVILSSQHGIRNVVASSGTALTFWHLKILKRYSDTLYTAYDMDLAGDTATRRGIDLARKLGFQIRVVVLEEGKDPADVISHDPAKWEHALGASKSIMEYYFDTALTRFDTHTAEGKRDIGKMLLPVIKQVQNAIEQAHWVSKLSQAIEIPEESIYEELKKVVAEEEEPLPETETKKGHLSVSDLEFSKTRLGLLEERLLSLLVREPLKWEDILKEKVLFSISQFADIFKYIKKKKAEMGTEFSSDSLVRSMQNDMPPETKEVLEQILLRAEVESHERPLGDKEWEAEIRLCVSEMSNLSVRARLREIAHAIRRAEEAGSTKEVAQLLEEFSKLSGQLN